MKRWLPFLLLAVLLLPTVPKQGTVRVCGEKYPAPCPSVPHVRDAWWMTHQ